MTSRSMLSNVSSSAWIYIAVSKMMEKVLTPVSGQIQLYCVNISIHSMRTNNLILIQADIMCCDGIRRQTSAAPSLPDNIAGRWGIYTAVSRLSDRWGSMEGEYSTERSVNAHRTGTAIRNTR